MLSPRQEIVNHYLQKSDSIKEAAAAAAITNHHLFQGDDLCEGVVVRVDLNGYSDWARDHEISDRVNLLDDFFTKVVSHLHKYQGIYFRDEGDCIVSLFSSYFELEDPYAPVDRFCKAIVRDCYGVDQLTAKAIVAAGEIAFYQKSHELATGDWSAEGEPFVKAVRLEQAVESKQQIYYFADDYHKLFRQYVTIASTGQKYYWQVDSKNTKVQGLGAPGGWVELVIEEYIPGGWS